MHVLYLNNGTHKDLSMDCAAIEKTTLKS